MREEPGVTMIPGKLDVDSVKQFKSVKVMVAA
jgi:hypothetical protein